MRSLICAINMFINSRKIVANANRLVSRNLSYPNEGNKKIISECSSSRMMKLHTTTTCPNYAAAATLPIPQNIDAAETTRFSPQRARDISSTVILSQYGQLSAASMNAPIDITTDNTLCGDNGNSPGNSQDPHVQSYDCFGAVSLNSAMQSNVPQPFGGMHKFTHLNMPGGQWSQEGKFTSQNLHSSHYTTLRSQARANWMAYDQDATINKKDYHHYYHNARSFCTKANVKDDAAVDDKTNKSKQVVMLSKKEQLKKAFKDYGSTVVVFHVAISLLSLGGCYLLVSGGIDMMPILEKLGLASTTLAQKVAAGASTFVVAYAIHKVFAPVRISITLGATPFIVRYLRAKGFLKSRVKSK